ncbi:superinfection immunity protein [Alkalibacillus silvisoli]|uniref:Superinfection immunity protein n=1 Tax=Alkalibacillus silvisoli TaxID=392823 RepID=A0ABP3JDC3_9BACI
MEAIALALVVKIFAAFVVLLYFTPTLMALKHNHEHRSWIVLLNLLIGWTILGWLIILIWSIREQYYITQ